MMDDPVRTQTNSTVAGRLTRYMWLLWIVWLSFLVYPLNALYVAHPAPLRIVVVLAAAALFVAVYVWNIWHSFHRLTSGEKPRPSWPALAVLLTVAVALTLGDRRDWIELFIFLGVSMGPSLPGKQAAEAVGAIVLLMAALGLALHAGAGPAAQIALQGAASGFAVIIVVRTVAMERELRQARGEIARLAVSEERLRFARDLHDLLGHSLSLIALKSELAGRLSAVAPDRAAAEMRDVESAARAALQEVREAVAGYRQPTLASELEGARQLLDAAGVAYERDGEVPVMPGPTEAVLSWAVREGVTNVIKHSGARHCAIHLTRTRDRIGVEVIDDGAGASPHLTKQPGLVVGRGASGGSGLPGLAERVAALEGCCEAGPRSPGPGFRLAVTLPLSADAPSSSTRPRDPAREGDAVRQG